MDKKRILFWGCFLVVLALIIWGLVAAMNKPAAGVSLTEPPPVTAADHVIGNPTAPVTLVEYGDFQCPACGQYFPEVERLFSESSSSMRLVFRHFPLSQHANAIPAAMASEAAGVQGKFWQMYRELYSHQSEWSDISDASPVFEKYATTIGLNLAEYKTDVSSSTLRDVINADYDGGFHIGINQTPTFFVNGKSIVGPSSYDQFKSIIEAAASTSTQ